MLELKVLHQRLSSLRRRRVWTRRVTATAALVTTCLWILGVVFAVDRVFEMDPLQRAIVFLLAAIAGAWAVRRYVLPQLRRRESEVELALQVERRQGIGSDLVAAIQFERADAAQWGSAQLQTAVMHRAANLGKQIDFRATLAPTTADRSLRLAVVSMAAAAAVIAIWPDHVWIFAQRLLMASNHYPSATVIEQIRVDGVLVLDRVRDGTQPKSVTRPEGQAIPFVLTASGRLPPGGYLELRSRDGRRRRIDLDSTSGDGPGPTDSDAQRSGTPSDERRYQGNLPRLIEPVTYQAYLGDAWSDAAEIRMVPLPVVESTLTPILPAYAQNSVARTFDPTSRQLGVLEGSQVRVAIECKNGKPLASAWLSVIDREPPERYELTPDDTGRLRWRLTGADNPFLRVERELRFEIQVVDEDGLSLEVPLRGLVRIRPDRPPTCSAGVVHRVVLPTATPVIEYRAADDYALAAIRLYGQIERASNDVDSQEIEHFVLPLVDSPGPLLADQMPVSGRYALDLAALPSWNDASGPTIALLKGDRLKLTIEALDYRGILDGDSTRSEPLILEISDESGVLTAISEADERTEERLSDLIKQQLGIGSE